MVKVYFESNGYAELVAVFCDEKTYELFSCHLEQEAKLRECVLTESVEDEIELIDLIK